MYLGGGMYCVVDSQRVVEEFLDKIWDDREGRFSSFAENELGGYLGTLGNDPATPDDWWNAYQDVFGIRLTNKISHTSEEVFTLMLQYTARYAYSGVDKVFELLELLHSMRYRPEQYAQEWAWWNELMESVSKRDFRYYSIQRIKPQL